MTARNLTFLPDELAPAPAGPQERQHRGKAVGNATTRKSKGVEGGAVHGYKRSTLPPLVLPTEITPELRAYLDGFEFQYAVYRAWRSTALFLAGQSDYEENGDRRAMIAGAFEAYDHAQAIAIRFDQQPELWHVYSGECVCPVCVWDALSAKWDALDGAEH